MSSKRWQWKSVWKRSATNHYRRYPCILQMCSVRIIVERTHRNCTQPKYKSSNFLDCTPECDLAEIYQKYPKFRSSSNAFVTMLNFPFSIRIWDSIDLKLRTESLPAQMGSVWKHFLRSNDNNGARFTVKNLKTSIPTICFSSRKIPLIRNVRYDV